MGALNDGGEQLMEPEPGSLYWVLADLVNALSLKAVVEVGLEGGVQQHIYTTPGARLAFGTIVSFR